MHCRPWLATKSTTSSSIRSSVSTTHRLVTAGHRATMTCTTYEYYQYVAALASTPPGMPGTHPPPIFWLGGTSTGISPPILLRTFGYSRPIFVALRSLSLKPFSFGYKTPPIRFNQAGGQSAHKARPPNLELALTPLTDSQRRAVPLRPLSFLKYQRCSNESVH